MNCAINSQRNSHSGGEMLSPSTDRAPHDSSSESGRVLRLRTSPFGSAISHDSRYGTLQLFVRSRQSARHVSLHSRFAVLTWLFPSALLIETKIVSALEPYRVSEFCTRDKATEPVVAVNAVQCRTHCSALQSQGEGSFSQEVSLGHSRRAVRCLRLRDTTR